MADQVSLRKRLTWYVVATLLLMSAATGAIIYRGTMHEADEILSASLVQSARILDGLLSRESIEINRHQLMHALERGPRGHKYERKLFFAVIDADGKILLHTLSAPEIPDEITDQGFSEFRHGNKSWLTYSRRSSRDDLRIIVGERSEIREEIVEYIGGGLLLPLLLLMPIALWLLWHIVGIALRPLDTVTDQVRQQDIRRLRPFAVDGVPSEISPLVNALNQMVADLDAAYLRERRFASDAAHELRNPLAGLLINVDNALEESHGREVVDSLQSMKTSIQRLSHLVAQLLELSRFESPLVKHEFRQFDLAEVIARVAEGFSRQAAAQNIEIECCRPDEPCMLTASEPLLHSLISNLIDNALKFGGDGCRVRLSCTIENEDILFSVEDSGTGLEPDERDRVTGRFYRAGDTNKPGAGLGLSIVKSISDIHSASIELGESELGGLAVRVRFASKR